MSPFTVTGIVTVAPGSTVAVPIIHIPASPITIGSAVVVSVGAGVVSVGAGVVSVGAGVVSVGAGVVSVGAGVVSGAITSIQPFCFSGVNSDMLISNTDNSSNVKSYLPGSVGAVNVTLNTTELSSGMIFASIV